MLKLLTWNIQYARTPDGGADLDRVAERLAGFADFDLLCVQQVSSGFPARDGGPGGEQFAGLARRLPGYRPVFAFALDLPGAQPDASGGASQVARRLGSMLFTRHPVLQVLRHTLPWPADPEAPGMPRCALEVTLATPLGPLRVTNVELETGSARQRLAQAERLRALHAEACAHARLAGPIRRPDDGAPFARAARPAGAILLGSFNMLPVSSAYARLLADFEDGTPAWMDAWQLAEPGRRHPPTIGLHDHAPGAVPVTFDYAFVSADLAPRVRALRVDGRACGSDHQPLLLELA
jgi:endonuclease/exonuclease/phosphatase family metal-dependent hydrolase